MKDNQTVGRNVSDEIPFPVDYLILLKPYLRLRSGTPFVRSIREKVVSLAGIGWFV